MSITAIGIAGVVLLLVMIFMRVPIAIALGLAVAGFLARAPALRHQLVTAGSVLALLAGAVAWA